MDYFTPDAATCNLMDFFAFLIAPRFDRAPIPLKAKPRLVIQSVLWGVLLALVIMLASYRGSLFHARGYPTPSLWDMMETILLLPILEEGIFRLVLLPTRVRLDIALILGVALGGFYLTWHQYSGIVTVIFPVLAYFFCWVWRHFLPNREHSLCVLLLWGSCIMFGAAHSANVSAALGIAGVSGYIFGKVINGFIFAWIRIRLGFVWAVAGHIFGNFAVMLVSLLILWLLQACS